MSENIVFFLTRRMFKRRDENLPQVNERKSFVTSFLLLSCFILFNAVPDFVFFVNRSHSCYVVVSLCWSFGCLLDPIIYIFLNCRTRATARRVAQKTITSAVSSMSLTKGYHNTNGKRSRNSSSISSHRRISELSTPSQCLVSEPSIQYQHRLSRVSIQFKGHLSVEPMLQCEGINEISEDTSSVEIRSSRARSILSNYQLSLNEIGQLERENEDL